MTALVDKASLRRRYLAARNALPPGERSRHDDAISAHLAAFFAQFRPAHVALYMPHRGEADVLSLGVDFPASLPVITGLRAMIFKAWRPGVSLAANRYGIMEPAAGDAVTFTERDVILVPSVALDKQGGRLGYGGGFYDRLLAETTAFAIGVSYQCCLADVLPLESHDVRLDAYVTERGLNLVPAGH